MATGQHQVDGGPGDERLGRLFNRAADAFARSAELAEGHAASLELEGDTEVAEAEHRAAERATRASLRARALARDLLARSGSQ